MSQIDVPLLRSGFGQTRRADNWWVQPLVVFLGLSTFIVYSTWAALQGQHFRFGPYLSPFYSPVLFGPQSWFGANPSWIPAWVTGAMLILWAPGGFRVTCYYYRGAYYKAFWADPPSCTVGEPRKKYLGERSLPLIIQNIHRYFSLSGVGFSRHSRSRRVGRVLVRRQIWDWRRQSHFANEPGAAQLLHPWLPFLPPPGRRLARPLVRRTRPQARLRLRELLEPASHAICLVQPFHRWLQ